MEQEFNAVEVFEIAQQIESDGAAFYRAAGDLFEHGKVRDTLLKLADWEIEHKKKFAEMKQDFSAEKPFQVREDADFKAISALNTFAVRSNPAAEFDNDMSEKQIIEMAIGRERDTIVFYRGLKNFLLDVSIEAAVDDILRQEFEHIDILSGLLDKE